ncbi:unnamed protein product, partial [marine sediment metagenome]
KEISEMTEKNGEEKLLEYNGILLSSQAAGPKILWFMKNEPELFKKTAKIVTATTYLVYRLTGRSVIDYYTASTFNPLFDCRKKEWTDVLWPDAPLDLLPEITWTTDIVGEITGEAAKETGLKEGTKVIAGTSDAASEAISSGVVENGDLMIMYGTSSFFIEITDKFAKADRNIWPTIFLAGLGIGYNKSLEDVLSWVEWDKKITPIEKNSSLYGEYFKLYKELYRATSKVSHNLVDISKR